MHILNVVETRGKLVRDALEHHQLFVYELYPRVSGRRICLA
ncbi:MAG: hypothetical protein OJF49_003992 [Ktedonobacterales bacterium]|nr:MAG: hypothetical protein OJF49_003992 [Ktedonobacterales bacterium]